MARLAAPEVKSLDPYALLAVLGKRVIHPGGRRATEELFDKARLEAGQSVLDVGCGVGTTAVEMAKRLGVNVTAVDVSPLMLDRARERVAAAGAGDRVEVRRGDILDLDFADATFDRVVAEAVTMFVDRGRATRELVRVCKPGGRVLATEFLWSKAPTERAKQAFLGELCPGMTFDTLDDWLSLYGDAGLTGIEVARGPFDMMTPSGFLSDEGLGNALAVVARTLSRPVYMRRMAWMVPRIRRAVPFLGYLVVSGTKPATGETT